MMVRVHIERLVLTGLPLRPSQGALVQAAVEAELARLWEADAAGPTAFTSAALAAIAAPAVRVDLPADPEEIGRQIARSLHGGVKP